MKLLYVANVSDLYGASRSLLRLVGQLVSDGHQVEVILPDEGPLNAHLRQAGAEVLVHDDLAILTWRTLRTARGLLGLLKRTVTSTFRLAAHIRVSRPDLVHTNSAVILSSGLAAKLCGVRHVWHIREFLEDASPLWCLYQWFIYAFSDAIVCISAAVAGQFHGFIRRRKTVLIHCGIPASEVTPPNPQRIEDFKQARGLRGYPLIGVVGRINLEQKGQDVFVRAAAALAPEFPGAGFAIVGSAYPGNEEHTRRLRQLVADLGLEDRFTFTGDVQDMLALHAALDICVLPARKPEGLGNVLVEAMALSKPLVGSAIGGIPEVIEDGMNGFLVEANDAGALADALGRLLRDSDSRQRMGAEGRRRFEKSFEFLSCYSGVLSLYSGLAGAAPHQQVRPMTSGGLFSETRRVLGMAVHATSYAHATERILDWARASESRYVSAASVNNVMEAHDSRDFGRIMDQADLVTPDGMPLVWGLRLLGARAARRVYGPQLTEHVLGAAERERIPVGLYGGTPDVLGRLLSVLRRRWPRLEVPYAFAPPFRPLTGPEDATMVSAVRDSGARILFIGLSTPKQERWMAAHRGPIPAVMLGVGAAFDFLAGVKPQAPTWMQDSGLEWLFRLATEPRRLFWRYLKHNPRFAALFAWQLLHAGRERA